MRTAVAVPIELLEKYDRPGPRYTSYPTAPQWTEAFGPADYARHLRSAGADAQAPLSLYVHVPFCESLCWFCACNVVITRDRAAAAAYVDDLLAEARLVRAALGAPRPVVQHHWGGGTPTFLPPELVERLMAGLDEIFPRRPGAEVSVEVDPRVTTPAHVRALARAGFRRISLGVQDFDPRVQQAVHRVQSQAQTTALVDAARADGFTSVNVDLIYGLPEQTEASFRRTLAQALALAPDRVACYGFAHVPWLKKHQRAIRDEALPRGRAKLALYLAALEAFAGAGYVPIGMDHFARAGDELALAAAQGALHRNFMGYTTRPAAEMVALGVSAISDVGGAFAQNQKPIPAWREAVRRGELPVERGLARSADDEVRRAVILDLMCRFRVDFARHGGADSFRRAFAPELARLDELAADGLVELARDAVAVTPLGRLLVRNVAMVFDAYLPRAAARFSRTV